MLIREDVQDSPFRQVGRSGKYAGDKLKVARTDDSRNF
jgi:hypothetical protein